MNELSVHPNVYATGRSKGLLAMLETLWLREQPAGDGTMYIVSGFANYNGGVRFYPVFRDHVHSGGKVVAVFAGNARQKLTSRQVVTALLECGAEVYIVNRKRLMHMKSYGTATSTGELLVVTSGNFTGPGMAQNVEMAVLLDRPSTRELGFSWRELVAHMFDQGWNVSQPKLGSPSPAWQLLYDEEASTVVLDETDEVTMALRLGHADTVRINAAPGTDEAKGTQYFWLSKDCYDFFPPLTILNRRGHKRTYSSRVRVYFADLPRTSTVRVTFEAENNLDFRLGTGPLRGTGLAASGDWAGSVPHRRESLRTAPLPARRSSSHGTERTCRAFDRPPRQALRLPLERRVSSYCRCALKPGAWRPDGVPQVARHATMAKTASSSTMPATTQEAVVFSAG